MLNTDCDNVLLAKHHFLWAEVAYLSCVQQLITFQDKNLHAHTRQHKNILCTEYFKYMKLKYKNHCSQMYSDAGECKCAATCARKNVTDRQVGQDSDCNDATSNCKNFSQHADRSQVRMLTESL
jgi:hypothetical protein